MDLVVGWSKEAYPWRDTHLYWIDDGSLRPIVWPGVSPGFFLVHLSAQLRVARYAGMFLQMKERIPLTGLHTRLTLIQQNISGYVHYGYVHPSMPIYRQIYHN